MSPTQWAELASCRVLFEDQLEWLRRHAGTTAKQELARICTADDAQTWERALAATPDPLPSELLDSLLVHLRRTDNDHSLRYLGERLRSSADPGVLRTLAGTSPELMDELRPLLAADGDLPAHASF